MSKKGQNRQEGVSVSKFKARRGPYIQKRDKMGRKGLMRPKKGQIRGPKGLVRPKKGRVAARRGQRVQNQGKKGRVGSVRPRQGRVVARRGRRVQKRARRGREGLVHPKRGHVAAKRGWHVQNQGRVGSASPKMGRFGARRVSGFKNGAGWDPCIQKWDVLCPEGQEVSPCIQIETHYGQKGRE